MGFSKKTGKGRLDKYYFLAKDQGFRARSAFKLIQLNKKYNFLEKARVLVDLCAAPGGWLQVASKYMPVSQLIIGIDLAAIKPIPGVITMQNDITTEKCRSDLKRELKGWKSDVFLNDGAPNVGSSWSHDAFSQAELTLSALKLATEFLNAGGTFVTKIFRSKDYNSLLWVFKQLFKTVEATKPASSRNVSAEIFVVCRGFLAPSSIDPKFLDPKHVFSELGKDGSTSGQVNIMRPEKKSRSREGYDEGTMILHKTFPAIDFVKSNDPTAILASANVLSFEDEASRDLLQFADEDLQGYCQDLKVIGRKEFKALLKWRTAIKKRFSKAEESASEDEAVAEGGEKEADPLAELEDLATQLQRKAKRDKRKGLERKAKQRLRMQLQMENTADLADDMVEEGLFSIKQLKSRARAAQVVDAQPEPEDDEGEGGEGEGDAASSDDSVYDSDDETARWEEEMEEQYQRFKETKLEKNALRFVKKKHEDADELEDSDLASEVDDAASTSASEEEQEEGGLNVEIATKDERAEVAKARAEVFFANPLFKMIDKAKEVSSRKRPKADIIGPLPDDEDQVEPQLSKKAKKQAKRQAKAAAEADKEKDTKGGIVFVPADTTFDLPGDEEEERFDEKTKKMMRTDAAAMTLAMKLVADRRRHKHDIVDDSFNRWSFGSTKGLPSWFLEDEHRNNRPQAPITKEAAAAIKEKMRRLEAQPNRKVLEAKGRNKHRAMKRIEAIKKKAEVIADSEEIGGRQKSVQIEKLMRSARKSTPKEKKVVIARGRLRGVKGRPKGVKGHYKMVDARAKKDTHGAKQKAGKGRRR